MMRSLSPAALFVLLAGLANAGLKNVPSFFTTTSHTNATVVDGTGTYAGFMNLEIDNDDTVEPKGLYLYGTYAGTGTGTLPSTLWATMAYNQSGSMPSNATAHGGAIFGRVIGSVNQSRFSFGVEGNAWGVSVSSTAMPVGVIGHAVWRGPDASTPTAMVIGMNARSEVTTSDLKTARATGTVIGVRSEVYGGDQKYTFYGVGTEGKLVNEGDIIKIRKPTQTLSGGGTANTLGACGGVLVIKSTSGAGAIATGSQAFTAPSAALGLGWNDGCEITVINGNLSGGQTITFAHSGTNLYTITGAPIVVGPLGGSFRIVSWPEAGVWIQTTAVTK